MPRKPKVEEVNRPTLPLEPEVVAPIEDVDTPVESIHISTSPIINVPVQLGFQRQPPGRVFIYVGAEKEVGEPFNWYVLGEDSIKIPIYENYLTGYVTGIRVTPKRWKDKPWGYKVDLSLRSDKEYVIRSGVETSFSKGLVNSLVKVEDLSRPICISVVPGTTEAKVVWCNILDGITGKGIFVKGENRAEKLSPLIFDLQARLGVEVQTGASIKQEIADHETRIKENIREDR